MKKFDHVDAIIPISLDLDWPKKDEVIDEILERKEKYGLSRFALACPSGGWRSIGYPPTEFFRERAEMFREVREALIPHGVDCGWWITITLKSGVRAEFTTIVKPDGTLHPFANCPSDPAFRNRLSSDMALFAKIAKPSFILLEDDYSIHAAAPRYCCFCENHLREFARREGRSYTREELVALFDSRTPESYALLRRWRELAKDTLVTLSKDIRNALDVETPEIPIGFNQPSGCDIDGDVTEAVALALAGPNHTPFSRLHGAMYGGFNPKEIPWRLYHTLYSKQHLPEKFRFYHESDTFPHTRFFTSGREIIALMSPVFAMGFDGVLFQTQQLLDHAGEEHVYAKEFSEERIRLTALMHASKKCRVVGAELRFDPFWNTAKTKVSAPHWTTPISMFSIPWTSTESDVLFYDERNAEFDDEETVIKCLSKPLVFLDAEAAQRLIARGFGDLIGVKVGGGINNLPENSMLQWDLGAREVIREAFIKGDTGRNMPSAHMLAKANGKMMKMEVTDPECEIIADMYTYDRRCVTPSITRFKNRLGAVVVVMGITVAGNDSQSLYNYRRQRLIHSLIVEHSDTLAFVREAPLVYTIMNDAVDKSTDFAHILTLVNLSSDSLLDAKIHLPPTWKDAKSILKLTKDGEWIPASYTKTDDGITLGEPVSYLETLNLMLK